MPHPLALLAAFALALQAPVPALAEGSPRDTLVVSTTWLAQHLKDPDLVLLHVGDRAEYEAAHIPGARFTSLQEISVSDRSGAGNGLTLEMLPPDTLRERLAALGISDNSRVVVYFGNDWLSPSTRVIFTLDYAGLGDRASLLNGGQPAWVRDGHEVTTVAPEPRAGTLSPLKIRPLVVTADAIREPLHAGGQALVDARDASFYDGSQSGARRGDPPRSGHLPGALSLPFSETTDDSLRLRSPEDLQARFTRAGVKPGDTVIGYCHIGQQATAMLFAARTLGFKVLLYDGSFEDWSRRPDFPLENPAPPAPSPKPQE